MYETITFSRLSPKLEDVAPVALIAERSTKRLGFLKTRSYPPEECTSGASYIAQINQYPRQSDLSLFL